MNAIAYEEYERIIDDIHQHTIDKYKEYLGYDDYEDEYGHNDIDEAQGQLLETVRKYIEQNNLPLVAFMGVQCIRVWKKEWYEEMSKRFGWT